ncbi:MAG: ABC transporter ATP-binding protein [Candidatus Brocadia sp. AMX2]|uniref:ABC transporter related protein n=1 Tax=Candidatus Brocadia sinica JPN1 TaxID=1197129 RepID=A0ABQ0K0T3_9BACT|nr:MULTISPECIES: ABC transporter ATP-binding protein [Brocadia]MBC6932720.1 ABC transporter ATP-binding protein [Candidatus Brocadia sp.]MBL1169954.1 ABC transporter ATP-binding protein [Candidatus Brocadia sp. AMX1]NOG42374.1 ABC transporter ATP-binding protein [Planctomycetota bacterium]GIK11589.1 MAG: ABC transporter ATP-binding protein [Candidatus Brocadia sinica]KAA0243172.1 MAG: ABC transporter ATP-binding protein [Candidatus Brocadia sp. AMX2]
MHDIVLLNDIYKIYTMGEFKVTALKGVSLSIKKGEFVAIMGASGSGKSTLMNILGCLDSPTRGKYYLEGVEVSRFSKNELAEIRNKKLGFVFQSFNLLSRTTVVENIELPFIYSKKISKNDIDKIHQIMRILGLDGFQKHYPNQLSGGQQQRVAIARAIVNDPTLLLADEPTGNLDSATSKDVMKVLTDLNHNLGITIVLVTHETDIAGYARRVVVLKDGTVLSDTPSPSAATPVVQAP